MKWRLLIGTLLAANLAALVYLIARPQPPSPTPSGSVDSSPGQNRRLSSRRPGDRSTTIVTNAFRWAQLESEDYRDYITRLRAIGCPEQTIQDIIIADLDKLFSPRLRALYPYRPDLQYWQSEEEEMLNDVNHDAILASERAVEKEKRTVIKELIGVDLAAARLKMKGQEDYYQRRLKFLTEEKRDGVREVLERYHELDWRIRAKQVTDGDPLSPADREELRQLQEAREEELQGLLTAEEKEQFDLWLSDTAADVRHDIYGMNATEEEFLTIYKARREFDAAWPPDVTDLNDPFTKARWELAKAALDQHLVAQLGENRFWEYQRGQDSAFHELSAVVARHQLPKARAVEVYEYKRAYQEFRDAVGFNPSLTPEQKDAAFRGIYEETVRAVQAALGEPAFSHYARRAEWLTN